MAAKRASARAAEPPDTEPMRKGGWINGSRADDNAPYDFRKSLKDAGHKRPLSADPSDSSFAAPGKWPQSSCAHSRRRSRRWKLSSISAQTARRERKRQDFSHFLFKDHFFAAGKSIEAKYTRCISS